MSERKPMHFSIYVRHSRRRTGKPARHETKPRCSPGIWDHWRNPALAVQDGARSLDHD